MDRDSVSRGQALSDGRPSKLIVPLLLTSLVLGLVFLAPGCGGSSSEPPPPPPSPSATKVLTIAPQSQQTPEWCWAAVAQMIFEYYREPSVNPTDYQCCIVGLLGGVCSFNCADPSCIRGIGDAEAFATYLREYPSAAQSITGLPARSLNATPILSSLSYADVQNEVTSGRPVVAGVTPEGIPSSLGPAHAVLIVGYDASNGQQLLIVNDPFPYLLGAFGPYGDPYLTRGGSTVIGGQYRIKYSTFVNGLAWTESIADIQ